MSIQQTRHLADTRLIRRLHSSSLSDTCLQELFCWEVLFWGTIHFLNINTRYSHNNRNSNHELQTGVTKELVNKPSGISQNFFHHLTGARVKAQMSPQSWLLGFIVAVWHWCLTITALIVQHWMFVAVNNYAIIIQSRKNVFFLTLMMEMLLGDNDWKQLTVKKLPKLHLLPDCKSVFISTSAKHLKCKLNNLPWLLFPDARTICSEHLITAVKERETSNPAREVTGSA